MASPDAVVLLAEGFEDIEAVTVIDVLRRGGVDVVTASISDSLEVTSAHGIAMRADTLLSKLTDVVFDAIILPGGMPGTKHLAESHAVANAVRLHHSENKLLCAICAAPTVFTGLGVLDQDLHVTCYPSCAVDLDRPSANVPVVVDANVITGQAPGSALLFSLVILKMLMGDNIAGKVAQGMVTDVLQG